MSVIPIPFYFNNSLVDSVQAFSITVAETELTGTASITSDVDLSAIFYTGIVDSIVFDDMKRSFYRITFDGSTVTATRASGDLDEPASSVNVTGYIVKFNPRYVKKVHHGTVNIATSADSGTSGGFDAILNNSAVLLTGYSTTDSGDLMNASTLYIELSGSDGSVTVTANRFNPHASITVTAAFNIIEFQQGACKQIQEVQITINDTVGSPGSATINAVDLDNVICLFGGTRGSNISGVDDAFGYFELTSTTNVNLTRDNTGGQIIGSMTVVEFNDYVLLSVERITSSFGALETTDNVTLGTTLTNLSKAYVSKLGWTATDTNWRPYYLAAKTNITSTTNIANVRYTISANTPIASYEVVQG